MPVYVIPELKLIAGWSPKAACTTLLYLLLTKLGFEIRGRIHPDMLNRKNVQSGKYGVYDLGDDRFQNNNLDDYKKLCVVRNPYQRLISGIRQRSNWLIKELPQRKAKLDVSSYTTSDFIKALRDYDYVERHFYPQTKDFNNIDFDYIFDTGSMNAVADLLDIEFNNAHIGGHETKYVDIFESYYHLTIKEISLLENKIWSKRIYSWFTDADIELINELYKDDFQMFEENGFHWIIRDNPSKQTSQAALDTQNLNSPPIEFKRAI